MRDERSPEIAALLRVPTPSEPSEARRRPREPGRRAPSTALLAALYAAGLIPILQIAWIVFTVGENNLSNDLIAWTRPIGEILDGTYDWSGYFRDTFVGGGHSMAVPVLFHLLAAKCFAWSMTAEVAIGLALFLVKLALLFGALTRDVSRLARAFAFPLFSLLVFSTAQVSTFTFTDSSLQMGLSQVGVALGVFALSRDGASTRAVACAGGLLASWSWGGGVAAWPAFALGLFLLGIRRGSAYALLAAGAALGTAPYFVFVFLRPLDPGAPHALRVPSPSLVANLLGRPFAPGLGLSSAPHPVSFGAGIAGAAALLALLAWRSWPARRVLRQATSADAPALVTIAWSLLAAAQIAFFRGDLAPWYTSPVSLFWIGLVGLALRRLGESAETASARSARGLLVAGLLALGLLAARSNATWRDKSFYLPSRSPASAACLREFRTAPTTCEGFLFQWGVGRPGFVEILATPLERHRLSTFAPRQTWLMQGDVALGRVSLEPAAGAEPFWAPGLAAHRTRFDDPRRLNLFLPDGATARWRVDVPPRVTSARLRLRARPSEPAWTTTGGGWSLELTVRRERDAAADRRHPFAVDAGSSIAEVDLGLDDLAGESVAVELRAQAASPLLGTWLVVERPRIELLLTKGAPEPPRPAVAPSNTDLSSRIPPTSDEDAIVPDERQLLPEPVPAREVSHVSFRVALEPAVVPRAFLVRLRAEDASRGPVERTLAVPLLLGGAEHRYTADLGLAGLEPEARVLGVQFEPLFPRPKDGGRDRTPHDVRLLRVRRVEPRTGSADTLGTP